MNAPQADRFLSLIVARLECVKSTWFGQIRVTKAQNPNRRPADRLARGRLSGLPVHPDTPRNGTAARCPMACGGRATAIEAAPVARTHARATVAAQVQAVLITDMGQKHPVASRPVRRWPRLPRPEPALGHAHQGARMAAGQTAAMVGTIWKLHDFLDAKAIAACLAPPCMRRENCPPDCFLIRRKPRRMRVSLRSRSFSLETPRHPVRAPWLPRKNALTHLPGVGCPIPKSDAT